MQLGKDHTRARFRLRTIFLIVNLAVLLLPLCGIVFFRIYENELVRQTERELISQAAIIAAAYQQQIKSHLDENRPYGQPLPEYHPTQVDEYYTPIDPAIDLAHDPLLPPRPYGEKALTPPDDLALAAGNSLSEMLQEAQRTTLAGIKILDYRGVSVLDRYEYGQSFAHIPEVARALAGQYQSVIRERVMDEEPPALASISRGTGIRLFIAMPIMHEQNLWGVVYLSRTPQNILKHLFAEKEKVILAGLTILFLALLMALLTSHTIARPIDRLVEKTKKITAGDHAAMQPLESPGTREIELLSKSFSSMAYALHERSEYIRRFATHVSHEFKTPLTGIQGAAELLSEHSGSMEEDKKQKFLANIIADTDRLKRLVSRLLELARADSTIPANQSTDLLPLLTGLQAMYKSKGLEISLSGDIESTAAIARDDLETILTNLCDNARQHGATSLMMDIRKDHRALQWTVSDNGEGISPANREKIFTPFFTTRREQGGTGLGLGIVKSILQAHGGDITIAAGDSGAAFILRLPQASS